MAGDLRSSEVQPWTCMGCGLVTSTVNGRPSPWLVPGCVGTGAHSWREGDLSQSVTATADVQPVSLECLHCGEAAITKPLGAEWTDGEGGRCENCGFPGHVSGDTETPAHWWSSDANDAVCTQADCDECQQIRKDFGLPEPRPADACPKCGRTIVDRASHACGEMSVRSRSETARGSVTSTDPALALKYVDDAIARLEGSFGKPAWNDPSVDAMVTRDLYVAQSLLGGGLGQRRPTAKDHRVEVEGSGDFLQECTVCKARVGKLYGTTFSLSLRCADCLWEKFIELWAPRRERAPFTPAIRALIDAAKRVPIARMRPDFSGLDCIACGSGPAKPCASNCWAATLEGAIEDAVAEQRRERATRVDECAACGTSKKLTAVCAGCGAPRALPEDLIRIFDEIGNAIASVEASAHAHGLTGQMLGARDCLRGVAAIRTKVLGTTADCASAATNTNEVGSAHVERAEVDPVDVSPVRSGAERSDDVGGLDLGARDPGGLHRSTGLESRRPAAGDRGAAIGPESDRAGDPPRVAADSSRTEPDDMRERAKMFFIRLGSLVHAPTETHGYIIDQLAALLDDIRVGEREACARIAEQYRIEGCDPTDYGQGRLDVAREIRARMAKATAPKGERT